MADGRIEFDTGIDAEGVNKAGDLLRRSFKRIASSLNKVFSTGGERLTKSFEDATQAIEDQERKLASLIEEYEDLEKARAEALEMAPEDSAIAFSETDLAKALMGNSGAYQEALAIFQQKVEEQINADFDSKAETLDEKIRESTKELKKLHKQADKTGGRLKAAFNAQIVSNFSNAIARAKGALTGMIKRLTSLASRVLIFNVISEMFRNLKSTLEGIFSSDDKLSGLLKDIKSNLLTAFQPIYEYILPGLYKIFGVIKTITAYIAQVMATIFHKDVKQMQANAKNLQQQIIDANATKKEEKKKEKAVKQTNKTIRKEAKKTKKELDKSLAGFDEITKLGEDAVDAADDIEDIADAADDLAKTPEIATPETETEKSPLEGMFDTDFGELSAKAEKIITWGTLIAGVALVIIGIATLNFGMILFGIGLFLGALAYGKESGTFADTPEWLLKIIAWGTLIAGIAMLLIGLITLNILLILEGVAFIGMSIAMHDAMLPDEPSWLSTIKEWGLKLFPIGLLLFGISTLNIPAILIAIELIKAGAVKGNTDAYAVVGNKIKTFFANVKTWVIELIAKIGELWTKITTTFGNVKTWFTQKVFEPLKNLYNTYIAPVVSKISEIFSTIKQIIFAVVSYVWGKITEKVTAGIAWLKEKLSPIVAFIKEKVITPVTTALTTFWEKIKSVVSSVATWIGDKIGDGIKWAINALFTIIENKVNFFIRGLNAISGKVSEWIPGVNISPIAELQIPRLATGTVVPANYGEFAAILGDNKRETEVVSPLSTIKQALSEALRENGGGASEITIYLSTAEVTRAIVNSINGQTQTNGVCPIKVR